jgi:hypothetical protein
MVSGKHYTWFQRSAIHGFMEALHMVS